MAGLSAKLAAALSSRDRRLIRRRLPEPPSDTHRQIDFTSNDYLSLSSSPELRRSVLSALAASPRILGSGGSRLLVPAPPHVELESRLRRFFGAEAALLFNSGFDANVGFFSAVPQPGDIVLYDAHIHASVHDGMRLSRLSPDLLIPFPHNSVPDLRRTLSKLLEDHQGFKKGETNVFVAVESLYSMDGTIAPLTQIVECVEEMLPLGNGHVVVDEAHATGIYGPKGRGLVVDLGLEKRVFARLHTFGKALAASGAVLLTTKLVKDYLLNYARSLVYTTSLPFSNIIAVNCSLDMLEDGTAEALSSHLLALSTYFVDLLRSQLKSFPSSLLSLPDYLAPVISAQTGEPTLQQSGMAFPWQTDTRDALSLGTRASPVYLGSTQNQNALSGSCRPLPTPIIPILTPEPRALSSFLLSYAASSPVAPSSVVSDTSSPSHTHRVSAASTPATGAALHTKPIYPPTIPKGTSRVRICLHAMHTREDVALLVEGITAWAEKRMEEGRRDRHQWQSFARNAGEDAWMVPKL